MITESLARGDETMVSFDLETTGLSPRVDRIIEIGAVKFNRAGLIDIYSTLADPQMPLSLLIQRLCGLRDPDLQGQPLPEEAVAGLALFSEGCTLVGHGVAFDMAFCSEILPESFSGRVALDTAELARAVLPSAPSHSLEELSRSLDLLHDRPHRALSDARATWLLLERLVETAQGLPLELRRRVHRLCSGSGWASGEYLARQLQLAPSTEAAAPSPAVLAPNIPARRVPEDASGGIGEPWIRSCSMK